MKIALSLLLAAAIPAAFVATAQEVKAPAKDEGWEAALKPGFDKLLAGKNEEAVKAWLKGGPIEGQSNQLIPALDGANGLFGKAVDYSWLKTFPLTDRAQISYAAVNYDTGVCYLGFTLYRSPKGSWVVNPPAIHSDIEEVAKGPFLEGLLRK